MPLSSVPVEYGGVCIKCKHEDGKCLDYSLGGPFLSTKKLRYTSISVPARGDAKVILQWFLLAVVAHFSDEGVS